MSAPDGPGQAAPPGVPTVREFDDMYAGTPPWDIGRPQPVIVDLANRGLIGGSVLDVGCGTGEHALLAAGLGLPAIGVDIAPTAIAIARRKAAEQGFDVDFEVCDARELSSLGNQFDTVVDSGLFHVFDDGDRLRYVASLAHATTLGGRCHVLCFSDRQPGDWGPRRVAEAELRASFADGWEVVSIVRVVMELTTRAEGVEAWLASFTRVD